MNEELYQIWKEIHELKEILLTIVSANNISTLIPMVQEVGVVNPPSTLTSTPGTATVEYNAQPVEAKPTVPTRTIPTRAKKAEAEPKVTIGTPNYRVPLGEGVLPKDIIF